MKKRLPRLNAEQNDFIVERLAEGIPMKAIVKEFQERHPKFGYSSGISDDEISHKIYQRIQKIKEKRHNEIQARRDADPYSDDTSPAPYLSGRWRAKELYYLYQNAEKLDPQVMTLKIRLLTRLHAEEKLLKANENKGKGDDLPMRDLVSELDLDPRKFENYIFIDEPVVRRLSDGVEFGADGRSLLSFPPPNDSEDDSDDDVYPPRIPLFGKIATVWDEYDTNDPRFWDDYEDPSENALDTNNITDVDKQPEAVDGTAITHDLDMDMPADSPYETDDLGADSDDVFDENAEPEPTEQDNFRRGIGFDRNEGNLFVK